MKSGIPMDAAFSVKNVQNAHKSPVKNVQREYKSPVKNVQRIPLTSGGEYTQLDIPLYALSQLKVECDALTARP